LSSHGHPVRQRDRAAGGALEESLAADITAFKSGKRRSPAMDPNVERLTARDIADIADYFAARPGAADATPARLSAL
jgi:cytochrome c553